MIRIISICCIFYFLTFSISAQNHWTIISDAPLSLEPGSRRVTIPQKYLSLQLDYEAMQATLAHAPASLSDSEKLELPIPMPNGQMELFEVYATQVMAPGLAAKFPYIRTFSGRSLRNPHMVIHFDYSLKGFRAMLFTEGGTVLIEPYALGQTDYYISFYKKDDVRPDRHFLCEFDDHPSLYEPVDIQVPTVSARSGAVEPVELRTYRLAIATSGEYANAHGGTVPLVLSEVVTVVNRVSGILKRDMAVELQMVENNELLIFLDPATDGYTNGNTGDMIGQNTGIINTYIDPDDYDMGHVLCTNGGGLAQLRSICGNSKARGVSCWGNTNGDGYYVDVVAHEMGHQFGASHTWNNCPPSQANISSSTAYEPGSGSTIMSYSGICGANDNVQFNSDDYYHVASLEQMYNFTRLGNGNSCPQKTNFNNNTPVAEIPYEDDFYIPIRTPFALTGIGSDVDGDALTYCWEQFNLGPSSTLGSPEFNAPAFRSLPPSASPTRVFPNMDDVVKSINRVTEVLPNYSRDFTFKLTVRDNHPDGGGFDIQEVQFKATDSAGPFLVQYPNFIDTFEVGDFIEVRWDVANTDQSPVNCQFVNILLSTDGGYTYPISLAEQVPNTGSFFVSIPDTLTQTARIQIQAADNIFFDISNANFMIAPPSEPGYSLEASPYRQQVCVPQAANIELLTSPLLNYDSLINFQVEGLPPGAEAIFSNNPTTATEGTSLMINMDNVVVEGTYLIEIMATAPQTDTSRRTVILDLVYSDFSAMAPEHPANGVNGAGEVPQFSWHGSPFADSYEIEIATSPTFGMSVVQTAAGIQDTFWSPPLQLEKSTAYFWRVRAVNECGPGDFTFINAFHTETLSCGSFDYIDGNLNIPSFGVDTIVASIQVPTDGEISDLNIDNLKAQHDLIKHLRVELESPEGTVVQLFEDLCGNTQLLDISLDDEAPSPIPCPPIDGQPHIPEEALSNFNGERSAGDWKMKFIIIDTDGQGGTFQNWNLQICSNVNLNSPFLVVNDTLFTPPAALNTVTQNNLLVEDADNEAQELAFTIVEAPQYGQLMKVNTPLGLGDKFTQLTINSGNLRYQHDGSNTIFDGFTFTVSDGEGGWFGTPKFNIKIDNGATVSVADRLLQQISLFPNPADDRVELLLPGLSESLDLRIINLQGQVLDQFEIAPQATTFNLRTAHLPRGMYFLEVKAVDAKAVLKLSVIH